MEGSASNMFQKNNILILEDSEHSFLILGKDIMESIRGSSPDGASDDDCCNDHSAYSSASQCHESADKNQTKLRKMLKEQKKFKVESNASMKEHECARKLTTFQEDIALTVRETSENRDLIRSFGGSIDEIRRSVDYMEQSVHSTVASTSSRTSSLDGDVTLEPSESAQMQKTNTSDAYLRVLEIENFKLMNEISKEQYERLHNDSVESTLKVDQSLEAFFPNEYLTKNLNAYTEALQRLNDNFASTYFRYTEQQNIILACTNIINAIESMKFKEDSSLTESDLAEYKKKLTDYREKLNNEQILIMEDKRAIINEEGQFHNLLLDHSFLVRKLASATLANKTSSEATGDLLILQQLLRGLKKEEEIVICLETSKPEIDAHPDERKVLKYETIKKTADRQEQSRNVEKLMLEKKALHLELESIKDERDALLKEKSNWSEEREILIDDKKILEGELRSCKAEHEVLKQIHSSMITKFDRIQLYLQKLKDDLADASMSIHYQARQLQQQTADLQETKKTIEDYTNKIEEQGMDISRLQATEKSNLHQIESLTDENSSVITRFDRIKLYVDKLKADRADASMLIHYQARQLQQQTADLHETKKTIEDYTRKIEKQGMDISRLQATEESNLHQIESLTDENSSVITRFDRIKLYVDKLKADLADASMLIHYQARQLQIQTADLQETKKTIEDYTNKIEKQGMDISRLQATEKSNLHQIESLTDENSLLKTRSDSIKVDLNNLKAELADARTVISELQKQNEDLQETENAIEVYTNKIEKQGMDISRLQATEKSNLHQIESLTDENSLLKTRSDSIKVDLNNLKAKLADARTVITELQKQNEDLQKTENAIEVYKDQIQKQKVVISRLQATEKRNSHRIESLLDQNKILRNYINKKFLIKKQ